MEKRKINNISKRMQVRRVHVTTLTSHVKIISITFWFNIWILVCCLSRRTCWMLTRRDLRIEIGLVCPTWCTMRTTFAHNFVPGTVRILQCNTVTVREIKMQMWISLIIKIFHTISYLQLLIFSLLQRCNGMAKIWLSVTMINFPSS